MTTTILGDLPREVTAHACTCGGYCDPVDSTKGECKEHGCFRDSPGNECCAASFICRLCGERYAGSREAPEYYG